MGGESRHLHILWTNADPLTAQFMVMMYATNAMKRGWWDAVTVVVWGATAKLAAEHEAVRERIRTAQREGVRFSACVACARELGVVEALEAMEIEIKPWGKPLTDLIDSRAPLITV